MCDAVLQPCLRCYYIRHTHPFCSSPLPRFQPSPKHHGSLTSCPRPLGLSEESPCACTASTPLCARHLSHHVSVCLIAHQTRRCLMCLSCLFSHRREQGQTRVCRNKEMKENHCGALAQGLHEEGTGLSLGPAPCGH